MKITRKLYLAAFLYKGVTIKMTGEYLPPNMVQILEQSYLELKDECKVEWQHYLDQLDELIENQHLLEERKYYWLFITNIFTLTRLGSLKQDEFNGTLFMYEWKK